MNTKDYFKDIYNDFFKVELSQKESSKEDSSLVDAQSKMTSWFDEINKLYITDESKDILKKMIEYMRKYHEQIEKNYVPFSLLLQTNNNVVKEKIESILFHSSSYFDYIESKTKKIISLYNLEKDDLKKYGFITFHDINGLQLEDEKNQKKFFYEFEDFVNQDNHNMIILSGTKEELVTFFLGRENIKNSCFKFHIIGTNPDVQDIYQSILEKVELDDSLKVTLLDYISKTYNEEQDYIKYMKDLVEYISFHKQVPTLEKQKSIDEVFAELNELVGLEKVKKVLHELVDVMNLKEKAKDNLNINNLNLHMVFLGNPGTGKTTIARIVANILYELKYIKENKLIEVSSKDLVAEYVGQTAPKTMSVIEKSLNGVLFIDEAYSLAVKGENSYNAEAIATLIQAMENYRDKLVVIFAGYTKEMQDFLNSNSGITSRIGYTLEFEDYTTDELIKIFLGFMKKSGFEVEEDAITYLKEIIEENRNMKNFGNARFVRNIYEKTIVKHASNVKNKKQKKILKTITKEDISTEHLNLD